jgi:phosphoadenosine phosphosulfate reductase
MTRTAVTGRFAADRTVAEAAAERYALAGADEVLAWAAARFGDRLAVAASMADTALPHLVAQHVPGVDVLFIDTGYHFAETLRTRDEAARLDVTVVDVRADLSVAQQGEAFGADLFARDPAACCRMRKVEPLRRALGGYDAWVTGVRREESPTRAETPLVEWDETFDLVKINPVAAWTAADVDAYVAAHDLPTNPLAAQGYPSIGCAPCTRPVADGQDARSGRWSGFAKTECGLHPARPTGQHAGTPDPTTRPAQETR